VVMKKKIRPRIGGWLYFPLQNAIWSGAGSELPRRKRDDALTVSLRLM